MIIRRLGDWPQWDLRGSFEELERMKRQMDRLLAGLPGGLFKEPSAGVFPLANVTEDEANFYVRAELPGIKSDELDISITGNDLSVSGQRKFGIEDEGARYHRREREAGRFSRVITLPALINAEKAEAHSTDGVLTITLPKAESAKPKQINIKTS